MHKFIKHIKNYYFKLNGSLKCVYLNYLKNLDVSQLQRYLTDQRTITAWEIKNRRGLDSAYIEIINTEPRQLCIR
jgi:hypothetical protein